MEDFFILNAGYQSAINDSLNELSDLYNIDIIKDRLNRISEKHRAIHDNQYKGTISKYYYKENDLGFILYDDIYELKGIMILVSKKEYKELDEAESIFIKNNFKSFYNLEFENQFKMKTEYNNLLEKFKRSL